MNSTLRLMSAITVGALIMVSHAAMASPLIGFWKTDQDGTIVEIVQEETGLQGYVQAQKGKSNKFGKHLLRNFNAGDSKGEWQGIVYVARGDREHDGVITMPGTDSLKLVVKAGFFKKTMNWVRTSEAGLPSAK